MTKPILIIDRFGGDFNAFNIAGRAADLVPDKFNFFIDSVVNSKDFDDAIRRIRKYVDVIFVVKMDGLQEKWIWKNGEEDRLTADTVEDLIEMVNMYKQTIKNLRGEEK